MILSMTGYGATEVVFENKKIHVEIKSLNSKSLDLSTRIAPLYKEKEMEIRDRLSKRLGRGKVDFSLSVEKGADDAAAQISESAVRAYSRQIADISDRLGIERPSNIWDVLVRFPDITQPTTAVEVLSDEEWKAASSAIDSAIEKLQDFRRQEGQALQKKFTEKIDNIAALLAQIEPYEKARTEKIRQQLTDRLNDLPGIDYDKNRLEQELIYYVEKLDISEEKQRLTNHLKYFRETMLEEQSQGKKLGFIAQEMGREINTTGSKSNQAEMQNIVVKMKDELEQIKEQVLNAL